VLCILVAVAVTYYSGPLIPCIIYFFVCMCRMKLVVEINYGGMFDRKYEYIYVGGQVDVHPDNVDPDNVSFILIESIVGQHEYSPGDLIYFRDPIKDLVDGLQLVSSDYDVAYMVAKHVDTPIVVLYIVSFQNDGGGVWEDWENDEKGDDGGKVDLNDPWWNDKISDDVDIFEEDYLVDSAAPQQCQKLMKLWRVMWMVMMVLRLRVGVRVGVLWVMVMARVGNLV